MSTKYFNDNEQLVDIAGKAAMDAQLSTTSTNGVQNKIVTSAINEINTHLTATEANGGLLNSKKMNCKHTTLTTDVNGILALSSVIGNPSTHLTVYGVVCNIVSVNYYSASAAYCILTDVQGVQYQNWQARVTNVLTGQGVPNTEFIVRVMWWEDN